MQIDVDEQGLYPPDAGALRPDERRHRNRVAIGTALVVWGTSLLVQRALGVDLDTFLLGLGLAAVAAWTQHRRYGWFVIGAIGTGAGLAALVNGPHVPFAGTLSNLCIAAGFAAIYVRYPRRSKWALAVAALFAILAVGSFGIALVGLVPAVLGRFLLPLLLIGGGSLLLLRHSLPPRVVKVGLAGLALTFVLVGATSVADTGDRPNPIVLSPPTTGASTSFAVAPGLTVVVRSASGSVRLRRSTDAGRGRVAVSGRVGRSGRFGAPLVVEPDRNRLLIGGGNGAVEGNGAIDYDLWLPDGAAVDIETSSGDVTGVVAAGAAEINTESGDIDLRIENGSGEGFDDDGPYDVETESGSVSIDSDAPLDLDLSSKSKVTVNQGEWPDGFRSPRGASGIRVEVDTESGPVDVATPTSPDASGGASASSTAPTASSVPTVSSVPPAPAVPAVPVAPSVPAAPSSD